VTLKTLITGFVTSTAVAAVVGGAAAGVTLIASPAVPHSAPATVAVQPVVWGIPLPQDAAPQLEPALLQTLYGLAGPGSFAPGGGKAGYIEGRIGRVEAITADRAYNNAAAKGYFPLNFVVSDIDETNGIATATVTATAANGASATQSIQFVAGPSPSGWQLSQGSALALLTAAG